MFKIKNNFVFVFIILYGFIKDDFLKKLIILKRKKIYN